MSHNFRRQKSASDIVRSEASDPHAGRSKTPPLRINSRCPKTEIGKKLQMPVQPVATPHITSSSGIRKGVAKSTEELSKLRINKEILSRQDQLHLKYNEYLQARLIAAQSKAEKKRKESKILGSLEEIQTKLLEIDEKIYNLDEGLEKILFLKTLKADIESRIKTYENMNESINSAVIENYVKYLENDLNIVKLKHFHVTQTETEISEIVRCLESIAEDLRLLPNLEEKTFPLNQFHSSMEKIQDNIKEEKRLKNSCEEKLKTAEELVYDDLYLKSLRYESSSR